MALIDWNESFSVGVKSLDEQHKGLVTALNELHGAMMRGESRNATGPLLDRLVQYTKEHFASEESLMAKTRYPEFAAHSGRHKDLTRQVQDYVTRHERGEVSINVHLLNFLRDWLLNHIQKEDRGYGPWLNSNGVS